MRPCEPENELWALCAVRSPHSARELSEGAPPGYSKAMQAKQSVCYVQLFLGEPIRNENGQNDRSEPTPARSGEDVR